MVIRSGQGRVFFGPFMSPFCVYLGIFHAFLLSPAVLTHVVIFMRYGGGAMNERAALFFLFFLPYCQIFHV